MKGNFIVQGKGELPSLISGEKLADAVSQYDVTIPETMIETIREKGYIFLEGDFDYVTITLVREDGYEVQKV